MTAYNTAAIVRVRNAFAAARGIAQARVDVDGTVRVYDSVAGHWTVCHSLTERQMMTVRAKCRA